MLETCWAYTKYNKITSGTSWFFYSSVITIIHGPRNIRLLRPVYSHIHNIWYLLNFHGKNGFAKAPELYDLYLILWKIIWTLCVIKWWCICGMSQNIASKLSEIQIPFSEFHQWCDLLLDFQWVLYSSDLNRLGKVNSFRHFFLFIIISS